MCINIEYLWFILGQFSPPIFVFCIIPFLYYHLDFYVQD